MDWSKYPNFTELEMKCSETGECAMNEEFMALLQRIRTIFNRPMIISSGYRSKNHSVERIKPSPGEHTFGMAVDVLVYGENALLLVGLALIQGITRIGVNQKGDVGQRYIHLGVGDRHFERFASGIWSY